MNAPEQSSNERVPIYKNPMAPDGEPIDDMARSLRNVEYLLGRILTRLEEPNEQSTDPLAGVKPRVGRPAGSKNLSETR